MHAVVNGELYDYDRIRADLLEKTAYTFKGRSDCEIVIALYKYYGLSFLSHLRGEFALVLYDERSQLFVAARDRYGVKPLFWTIVDGRLLVAAEAKAFLPLGWQPEWDVRSLMDAGWRCDQRTVFKGVQTLRPGCYLTVQSFGFVETREFWDMEFRDKVGHDYCIPGRDRTNSMTARAGRSDGRGNGGASPRTYRRLCPRPAASGRPRGRLP